MLALTPMFFASNYFYAYQGAVNAFYFDGPTRAVNATLEGAGAIIGALIIGIFILDAPRFKRRTRGWLGLAFVTICTIVIWSCALSWQVTFTRHSDIKKMSYHDSNFATRGTLYFFFYFGDAAYQALAYWIMGAITNDPFKLARYAGFYKALQSAGSAGSFGMDAVATPFLNEHVRGDRVSCSFSLDADITFIACQLDHDARLLAARRSCHLQRPRHLVHR